ncbi:PQQ-binding-like beta-propeller repeat protein [Fervidobacterium thailandense]|uniref:Pyrrolo-quinoline quinone repeat domain-containing protein n=1 Tax=Fervidobacterium thailandense TaxID=1008305 RepID=A0A1E3G1T3_9BACT|nr:PQQ-binding-like beta-propeller repeat protein [Fervidobacterium thailandense]ODN30211.1 hypothetical protein A4H02_06525 [Fervidobacterium thailandense]
MFEYPRSHFKIFVCISLALLLLTTPAVSSGMVILTNDNIITVDGKTLKSGNFRGVLYDGTTIYYITADGIFSVDDRVKIDIKGAVQVGPSHVLAGNKVYKIQNGRAIALSTISPTMRSISVRNDYVIGIDGGQVVCYQDSSVIWSIFTPAESIKVSADFLAVFTTQTQLFNISNPRYVKLERFYPAYEDYAYFSGYHAFSDGSRIHIYKGASKLSVTFPYRGPLFSDGTNLYSGNTVIGPDLTQRTLNYNVRYVLPTTVQPEFLAQGTTTTGTDQPRQQQSQGAQSVTQGTVTMPTRPAQTTQTQQEQTKPQEQTKEITQEVVKPEERQPVSKTPKLYELVWRVNLNDEILGKPAVKGDTAYVATLRGNVFAINSGRILWNFKTNFVVVGHVTVGKHIYVVCWDDTVYALDDDGKLKWKLKLDGDISNGAAWDGYNLYVVTDNGTVYIIRDNTTSATIVSTYKTASLPVIPPSISVSGKVFVVDGLGNLWREKTVSSHVGKIRNLPVISENPQPGALLGFNLVDEYGTIYRVIPMEKETIIQRDKVTFLSFSEEVQDAVLGRKNIYVLTSSGKLYVIDRSSKKILFTDTVAKAKYISVSDGYLFVFGSDVSCYYVADEPSGLWNSIYGNALNWNAALR